MIKLQSKDSSDRTITYQGEVYPVRKGIVEVPDAAAKELTSFGFKPYVPPPVVKKEFVQ